MNDIKVITQMNITRCAAQLTWLGPSRHQFLSPILRLICGCQRVCYNNDLYIQCVHLLYTLSISAPVASKQIQIEVSVSCLRSSDFTIFCLYNCLHELFK